MSAVPRIFANRDGLAAVILLLGVSLSHAAEHLPGAGYFGAVTTESRDGRSACASLEATTIRPGTPVAIVVLSTPQRLLKGRVGARASAGCTRYFEASESAAFHEIDITEGRLETHELGVLVLPGPVVGPVQNGTVALTLDRRRMRFYECAGSEGIHLGLRSAAKDGRFAWHDYIYLGIDVEPTCRKADHAAIEALRREYRRATDSPAR
jgi:hypothetical protein